MSDVQVSIGASLKELTQGLNQAGELVKDFKTQAGKAQSIANYFAKAINTIGGEAGKAGMIAANLLGAFAVGGPMGLAIGGVNALIGYLGDMGKEEDEARKKFVELGEQAHARLVNVREDLADINRKLSGMPTPQIKVLRAIDQEGAKEGGLFEQEVAAGQKVNEARAAYERAKGAIPAARSMSDEEATRYYANLRALYKALQEAQAAAAEKAREAKEYIDALNQTRRAETKIEKQEKGKDLDDTIARAKIAADNKVFEHQLELEAAIEKAKIDADNREFQRRLDIEEALAQAKIEAENRAFEANYEAEQAAVEDRIQGFANVGQQIGSTIGRSITEGMAPAKTIGAILQTVTQQFLAHAVKQIGANALVAGSESAKTGAIFGPAGAAAAMAATVAVVMGLLGSMPSAAGGFDIPSFMNPLVQTHAGEMILPAKYADVIRRQADEPQAVRRGDGTTYNITAMDGRSVERVIADNDGAFAKAERKRNRRRG